MLVKPVALTVIASFILTGSIVHASEPLIIKPNQQIPKALKDQSYFVEPPAEDTKIPTLINPVVQEIPELPGYSLWTYKMFGINKEMEGTNLSLSYSHTPVKIAVTPSQQTDVPNAETVKPAQINNLANVNSLCDAVKIKNGVVHFEKKIPANTRTMLISLIAATEREGHLKSISVKTNSKSFKFQLCGPLLEGEEVHQKSKTPVQVDEKHFPVADPAGNG